MASPRTPSLLGLRAFEAAARRLSFTEAARELHVSQAAVSNHVRALERNLGRPLFRRLHRKIELTPPGKRLAKELICGFLQIHRAVDAVRGIVARPLRLSVEPTFAARWLVPRLGGFSAANPDIELELESSDELRVIGRDADIAIRYISPAARPPRGRSRQLFSNDGVPVIARAHIGRVGRRGDAAVAEFCLLHDDDGTAWRSWFAAAGLEGFDVAKHLRFNEGTLALTAALRGQGVALGASIFVAPELKSRRLARVGRTRVRFGDFWLLEATDRATAASRAAFVAWLDSEIKKTSRSIRSSPDYSSS